MVRIAVSLAVFLCCIVTAAAQPARTMLRVGGRPIELFAGRGSLWVLTCDEGCTGEGRQAMGRMVRIDPGRARVTGSVRLSRPGMAAVSAEGVYVTDFWRDTVRRRNPQTLQPAEVVKLKLPFSFSPRDNAFLPEAVVAGAGFVWVATDRGALARADLRFRRVISTTRLPAEAFGDPFGGMAVGGHAVWLAESLAGVYRVNPRTGRIVARVRIALAEGRFDATEVIPCGGEILVLGARTSGGTLTPQYELARIDVRRNRGETLVPLPAGPLELTCGAGSLWLGQPHRSVVERIDPSSGKVTERRRARVGASLAFAAGRLWTAFPDGTIRQLGR
jgi:hypothetical protein